MLKGQSLTQFTKYISVLGEYRFLFALWAVQGVIALAWLLLIPTDSGFYSIPRIALAGFNLLIIITSIVLINKSRDRNWLDFSSHLYLYNVMYVLALLAIFLPIAFIAILHALGRTNSFAYITYAERLTPLAFWVTLSCLEWCLLHIFWQRPDYLRVKQFLNSALYILLAFTILPIIVFFTGWGISPVRDGSFGSPPTPLLEWQIVLAVVLGAIVMLTEARWQLKRLDTVLFLSVYLFTCLLWLSDPLIPGFFATPPRAPNFEVYPFSDALIYAQYAQSALVGEGFLWPDIPARPLYVTILTWMYALVGQDYYHVIRLQTILLAFFPAMLYLLGRELGSRPLGVMLALLAALRDITTNHTATFSLNYSYSKLFFSEIPTALLLVIFTLLAIRWMKSSRPGWYLLMMGGTLGVAALIRLQSVVMLVPLALFSALVMWKTRRSEWIRGQVFMVLGVALMLAPWLTRNYYAAGGLVIDNPISQSMVLARRWSGDSGNTLIAQQPNETMAQYASRMNSIAFDNLKREPGRILSGAANHFFNNLIASLHILPVRDGLNSLSELFWPEHMFWRTGVTSPLLTAFYTILLALGLAYSWQSSRWVGLLPFGFSIGYHAWTALFLSSGDRFLIPIDWTWYLYYCLGILVLLRAALFGLRSIRLASPLYYDDGIVETPPASRRTLFLTALIILLVGVSLPFSEIVFPERYPPQTREQLSATLGVSLEENEIFAYGRAIYPRYYEAGDGEPGSAKLGYGESDEARLVFWMAGSKPELVIVPLETAPHFFPHASDVWVVGHLDNNTLRARITKVEKDGKSAVYYKP